MEKQLQQQLAQMTNLQRQLQQSQQQNQQQGGNAGNVQEITKELEQVHQELQNATVERDRFQSQLEMLIQELEKSQVLSSFQFFVHLFLV